MLLGMAGHGEVKERASRQMSLEVVGKMRFMRKRDKKQVLSCRLLPQDFERLSGAYGANACAVCTWDTASIRAGVLENLQRTPCVGRPGVSWRLWQSGERIALHGRPLCCSIGADASARPRHVASETVGGRRTDRVAPIRAGSKPRLARLKSQDPTLCPQCGRGHLHRIEELTPVACRPASRSPP